MKINFKQISLTICSAIILISTCISLSVYKKIIIKDNTFRLHVVANSNNIQDQIVKLKISDKVNAYIKDITIDKDLNKDKIYAILKDNKDEILSISNNEIRNNDLSYSTKLKLGDIYYEEKNNLYSKMDAGIYDSIQLTLGDGEGKNYWDLIFPNKYNTYKLKPLETIIPGVSKIYSDEKETNDNEISYDLKVVELFNKIFKNNKE